MEFGGYTVITVPLRNETAFVVSPQRRGKDGLEGSGGDGGLCVRRPGEEDIAEVEDESRRFRKGHDAMYEKGERGAGKRGADRENEGGNREILIESMRQDRG